MIDAQTRVGLAARGLPYRSSNDERHDDLKRRNGANGHSGQNVGPPPTQTVAS